MKKSILLALILTLVLVHSALADSPAKKLGRGLANIATGWLEVPVQMTKTTETEGAISGLTVGLVKGLACTVGRTLSGVYDVITFPINAPKGYKSLAEPEFVLSDTAGAYKGF